MFSDLLILPVFTVDFTTALYCIFIFFSLLGCVVLAASLSCLPKLIL